MRKVVKYNVLQNFEYSDIIEDSSVPLFFNNGENERREVDTLRVLSLFWNHRFFMPGIMEFLKLEKELSS